MKHDLKVSAISALAVSLLIAILLCSCAGQKAVKQSDYSHVRDSVLYTHVVVRDTTHVTIVDSIREDASVESENKTDISFVSGGGSYNAVTGQATGVVSVSTSVREKELRSRNEVLEADVLSVRSENDSLRSIVSELEEIIENEEEPAPANVYQRSKYDRFCSLFFWIVSILFLLLAGLILWRRFGTIKPYTFASWIAKALSFLRR